MDPEKIILPEEEHILEAHDESFVPWTMYATLQSSIRFADNKINLLFVIAGIIFSLVITGVDSFKDGSIYYKIVIISALITMMIFMYYSVRTVAATMKHMPDVNTNKLYFFGDIVKTPASEFIQRFKEHRRHHHYDELLLQVHNLSQIAQQKFEFYTKSLYSLCAMIVLVMAMLLLKALQ